MVQVSGTIVDGTWEGREALMESSLQMLKESSVDSFMEILEEILKGILCRIP